MNDTTLATRRKTAREAIKAALKARKARLEKEAK